MPKNASGKEELTISGGVEKPSHSNIDTSKVKRTNRVGRSCTQCKKRKVKCNFEIPCDRCIARNQAHLCTRDPVIFDGLLISNHDTKELKFSQENEVLKKKIKELQDTIVKLKSINAETSNFDGYNHSTISGNKSNARSTKNSQIKNDTKNSSNLASFNRPRANITTPIPDNITSNNDITDSNNLEKELLDVGMNKIPNKRARMKIFPHSSLKLNEVILTDNLNSKQLEHCFPSKGKSKVNDNLIDWKTYSTTVSLLKKGLTNGLVLDSTNSSASEMDYNSEDWLCLNDKTYLSYDAEDLKSKCWLHELDLIAKLDKSTCDILVRAGLKINLLYPIIDSEQFLQEYEAYWADDTMIEKHISIRYIKSASNYLFLSLMYSLMCFGLYQCDEESIKKINFSPCDWDNYSKSFFSSSLEGLYRGRFMTHPNIKSIQIISIMSVLSGFLGGINLSNCLLGISFFLSYKMDLIQTEDHERANTLRYLLACDWYDDQDRYSLTTIDYGDFLQPIERYIPSDGDSNNNTDERLLNWNNYYLSFFFRIAKIKKTSYCEENDITLDHLKRADVELRYLKVESSRDIDLYTPEQYPNISPQSIECLKFHMNSIINHEILEVNLKMATFMSYAEWSNSCYQTCFSSSMQILKSFVENGIPVECKVYPAIFQHVIFAVVFLIVDCMLDENHKKNQKDIVKLLTKILPIFKTFKLMVRGSVRGIYVIEKLLILMKLKRKYARDKQLGVKNEAAMMKMTTAKTIKSDENKRGSVLSVEVASALDDESKGVADPDAYVEMSSVPNTLKQKRMENLGNDHNNDSGNKINVENIEESDEEDEEDEEDDIPFYFSTLSKNANHGFLKMLSQQHLHQLQQLQQLQQQQQQHHHHHYEQMQQSNSPRPQPGNKQLDEMFNHYEQKESNLNLPNHNLSDGKVNPVELYHFLNNPNLYSDMKNKSPMSSNNNRFNFNSDNHSSKPGNLSPRTINALQKNFINNNCTLSNNGHGNANTDVQAVTLTNSPQNSDSQLPIQNTIMDILEDSGWVQFINSINDLTDVNR